MEPFPGNGLSPNRESLPQAQSCTGILPPPPPSPPLSFKSRSVPKSISEKFPLFHFPQSRASSPTDGMCALWQELCVLCKSDVPIRRVFTSDSQRTDSAKSEQTRQRNKRRTNPSPVDRFMTSLSARLLINVREP